MELMNNMKIVLDDILKGKAVLPWADISARTATAWGHALDFICI